jgi:hypothetical protein
MGKADFMSPKAIGNRIKARGARVERCLARYSGKER